MANLFRKLRGAMLGDSYSDEDDYDEDEYDDSDEEEQPKTRSSESAYSYSGQYSKRNGSYSGSKIVSLHTEMQMEVIVSTPKNLKDASTVCEHFKNKRTIVVNLEEVEHEMAQRITDVLSGACYALEGSVQLVSSDIFVMAPSNVDISGQVREELQANGVKIPYTSMWK